MTRATALRLTSGLVAIFSFSACQEPPIIRVPGEPEVCLVDGSGALTQCNRAEQTLDFGPMLLDARQELKLVVRNVGRADMVLTGAEHAEGSGDHFSIAVTQTGVSVSQDVPLTAVFTPRAEGELAAVINLRFSDATVDTFPIRLAGRGVKGGCLVEPSEVVDFGSVATGDSWSSTVTIRNASDLPWPVTVGGITSDTDAQAFAFEGFAPGEHTIEAHGELTIPITFRPNHLGQHTAFLTIPAPALCQPAVLRLQGNGVEQVLTWEPRTLDFGFVNPNTRVTAEVTFKNLGNSPVQLNEFELADTTGKFAFDSAITSLEVAALGGEQKVTLAFKPPTLGAHTTTLRFKTDSARLPTGSVTLRGYGGGPDIEVSPRRVTFGQVGIGSWQERRVVVANVGSDAPATTEDNLKLSAVAYEWEPKTGHGFQAVLDGYTAVGIQAGASIEVRVKFTPTELGTKQAKLRIFSNDPDEPMVELDVSAEGADLPPCDYSVIPPQMRFGYVESGRNSTQSFHLKNESLDACVVSSVELSRTTPSAFTLPKTIALPATVAAGEALEVPVRFWPKTEGDFEGEVELFVNSITAPQAKVKLTGTSKGGCILVAPNDADFGVNKVNCSARDRVFTIYNSCGTTVTLDSLDVQAGISNEFRITQRPALPYTLTAGSSVDFKATYRPTDIGQDVGTISVQTAQLAHPYVVKVAGRGAIEAIQTDVFAQNSKPKMDILFVVDDSCSMYDKQTSLGSNFDAFMTYANSQQVDYHIAVTSTSTQCGSGGCLNSKAKDGRFAPENPLDVPSPATRVITPYTPNASALFKQNVMVGDDGSGTERPLEAAMLALSQNRLAAHNSGFLRPDAFLAIIIVTDTYDQSPNNIAFYYNYFLNVVGFRRANEFSISGIIPTVAGPTSICSYDETTTAIQSPRLRDIVNRSGGLFDNICTPDWSKTLEEIGRRIFGYKTRFFMTNSPDLSPGADPIRVYVNDAEYPATGPAGDVRWTYDSTTNSINFDPLTTPEPGDTVRVVYPVACLP